jgi:hypothetical protein
MRDCPAIDVNPAGAFPPGEMVVTQSERRQGDERLYSFSQFRDGGSVAASAHTCPLAGRRHAASTRAEHRSAGKARAGFAQDEG